MSSSDPLLILSTNDTIRQRRFVVSDMVQGFDAFLKVTDDVKEEPKAIKGICRF